MNDTEYLLEKMTRAFEMKEGRKLTSLENQFLRATAHDATDLSHASCDVPRMKALLKESPSLLETVGSVALSMAASYHGTHEAVRFLLDRGIYQFYDCETGLDRKHQHEPVTKAFYHGNFNTLRTVFEAGVTDASVISTSHVGWPANTSLLFWAVGRPVEYTEFALEYGADPEAPFSGNGERGNTPLQEAAARRGTERWNPLVADTVRALLEHGAFYDIFSACGLNDLERVRELAGKDAKAVTLRGEAEMTPLHWAARAGSTGCVKWLLRNGAEVVAETVTKRTPLHLAAERGQTEPIRLLAEHGASLNVQDKKGRAPLHRATYEGRLEAAEALIELGAATKLESKNGKTPLQVARLDCRKLKE
ncbi:MAG: ankyrin repeat domain-containing protein [Gemmatimonadetes bacterium]|nr:ankyrin repeat domain-containing protein [Gemmatimonadota bacterium]